VLSALALRDRVKIAELLERAIEGLDSLDS